MGIERGYKNSFLFTTVACRDRRTGRGESFSKGFIAMHGQERSSYIFSEAHETEIHSARDERRRKFCVFAKRGFRSVIIPKPFICDAALIIICCWKKVLIAIHYRHRYYYCGPLAFSF